MKIWRVPYPKFGDGPGLERVAGVAARLGVDLARFGEAGVGVVGTNGKGSTAAMCASLLRQRGALVGRFTSPHLMALNERFNINGQDIDDEALEYHWARVRAAVRDAGVEDKLGQRASNTCVVHLEDVKVPKQNLLAPEGDGFKLAMETFNQTRPDIAALATGLMQRCLDECVTYAKDRKTFGVPIAEHQMVQAMLADMAVSIEATRLLYQKAAWNLDNGVRDPIVSSFAKVFGADRAMQTATDAVQVFGGNGYVRDYPVEKLMRDAKLLQIYEGTSQVQRLVIARQITR